MQYLRSHAIVALALLGAACQNTSATGGGGSGGSSSKGPGPGSGAGTSMGGASGTGGSQPGTIEFAPAACEFTVESRPEYLNYQKATEVVKSPANVRRIRLGLGGNIAVGAAGHADPSTSIAFAWQTNEGTLASDAEWGTGTDPSKWPSSQRTSGVTWDTPQGQLNAMGNERMHEAYVCGLKPDTTYSYRVGGGPSGQEEWSDVYSFTTAPASNSTVKIALAGDSRGEQDNAWQLLEARVLAAGARLQMFSGDMINLAPDQGEWEEWIDNAWKDANGKPSALGQVLTLAAHGNHDNHTALFFGNLTLPQDNKKYPKYDELIYSVDVGPVHIVVMDDSWIAITAGDPDFQPTLTSWLNADLDAANKNRSKVPWIMTMTHRSIFSSSLHGQDIDVLACRQYFSPIYDKYHVDLAISGHDHNYERTKPLQTGADNNDPTIESSFAQGTVYLACAGAGADPYTAGMSPFTETSHDFTSGGAIGLYAYLTASTTSLKVEAHELRTDASDPVIDTFTITK